jgi:TPP-dependent pyruvate/acetoin dehydrogenase alpha subunit
MRPDGGDVLARQVLQIRKWQHIVNESLKQGKLKQAVHLAFGHEAIAVGVSAMMEEHDQLVLTHRNIAYNLARAGELRSVFDEYKMSPSGLAHGRLGTMNLANPGRGIVYTSSILGNNMPVACGLALGQHIRGTPGVVTVLTGDGAMEEGTFYESLLVAKSQRLSCLFVIENNNHSLASTILERRCVIAVEDFCKALQVPYVQLSGNDVFDYADKLKQCRARGIRDGTPVCVEVDLMILNRHAGPTPGWPADPMKVDYGKGLILREDRYDPVFVLRQHLAPAAYASLEKEVLSENWSE